MRWTKAQPPEQLLPVFSGLAKNAALVTGVLGRGQALEAQLTIVWPEKKLEKDVVVKAETPEGLLAEAETKLIEALIKEGLVTAATAPAGLLPASRSRAYLAALDGLAIELLAGLQLIKRSEVQNTSLMREQLIALVRDSGRAPSAVLLYAGALIAAARLQPDAVAAFAEDLEAMTKPPGLEPLELLQAVAQRRAVPKMGTAEDQAWAEGLKKLFPG